MRKSVVSGSFRAAGLDWSKKQHCGNTLAASCLRKKMDYDDGDDDDDDDDDDVETARQHGGHLRHQTRRGIGDSG